MFIVNISNSLAVVVVFSVDKRSPYLSVRQEGNVICRQAILAGAKEKRLAEARARAALMVKDKEQMEVRGDLLRKTVILFQSKNIIAIDYIMF